MEDKVGGARASKWRGGRTAAQTVGSGRKTTATGKGDGTSIPIVDAIGVTMKAVQELDQKVEKLGRGLAR